MCQYNLLTSVTVHLAKTILIYHHYTQLAIFDPNLLSEITVISIRNSIPAGIEHTETHSEADSVLFTVETEEPCSIAFTACGTYTFISPVLEHPVTSAFSLQDCCLYPHATDERIKTQAG